MERRSPPDQGPLVGLPPAAGDQRPDQQRLHQGHPVVGRHLERPQLHQPEAAPLAVGVEQFVDAELGPVGVAGHVDEEVAQEPVDEERPPVPVFGGSRRPCRGDTPRPPGVDPVELGEGDLELVEAVVAGLVDAGGLAGRPDEPPGEQVGQGRVVLPVGEEAAEQVGAAQQRAVGRRRAAEGHVVAAAGAGVGAVEGELLRSEAGLVGLLVDGGDGADQLRPAGRRVDVDLDHAGVGAHAELAQPGIERRGVALEGHRLAGGGDG